MKIVRIICLVFFCVLGQAATAGPKIDHWLAASGARVFFVENHDLPIVDVQVAFPAGSAYDPPGKAGLAGLTQGMLSLGSSDMDENAIASRLADLGAILGGGVDPDRSYVSLRTLSAEDKRGPALEVLRAVLGEPQFPADVFEREKTRSVLSLKDALTRPETIANHLFWSAMYPAHAYGRNATPESVGALKRADAQAFYQSHYAAQGAVVTLVGDLFREQAEAVAQRLTEKLPVAASTPAALATPQLPAASVHRIAHPAAQAHVLMGLPALKRGDPDFFPLLVGNYTLGGGGFVSRLMKEVREKRGFAYSVYSYFMPLAVDGPFQIGLQTKKEQATEALTVARDVLACFLAEGPSEEELRAAKQNLVGSFPLRLDSNGKILQNVAIIGYYGLPLDYLDRYAENVEKVTIDDVKAAFARHVPLDHLVTVVVGGE